MMRHSKLHNQMMDYAIRNLKPGEKILETREEVLFAMDKIVREEVAEPTKTNLCGLIEALGYITQSVPL